MKTCEEIRVAINEITRNRILPETESDILVVLHDLNDLFGAMAQNAIFNAGLDHRLEKLEADNHEIKMQLDEINQTHE